jgi:hypothetical protein
LTVALTLRTGDSSQTLSPLLIPFAFATDSLRDAIGVRMLAKLVDPRVLAAKLP